MQIIILMIGIGKVELDFIKKQLKLVIIGLLILFIGVDILKLVNGNCNTSRKDSDGAYMDFLRGTILEKNEKEDTLMVQLHNSSSNAEYFVQDKVMLDCSQYWISIRDLSLGDDIEFYFFKTSIEGNSVKVQYIEQIID